MRGQSITRLPPTTSISLAFPWQFADTHLYFWVERDTMKVSVSVFHNNTTQWPIQVSNLDLLSRSPVHWPKASTSSIEGIQEKRTSYPNFIKLTRDQIKLWLKISLYICERFVFIYTHTINVIQSSKYWIWRQQEYKHVMKNNSSISACCHIHKWYSQEWNYCSLEKKNK